MGRSGALACERDFAHAPQTQPSWASLAVYMQVAQLSWPYLDTSTRRSIRLTGSHGRLVADRLRDSLYVTGAAWSSSSGALQRAVEGMLARGAVLRRLRLGSVVNHGIRLSEVHCRLLSFLSALASAAATPGCAPQPIGKLTLQYHLPLSGAAASALALACPHVTDLTVDTYTREDIDSTAYGIMQLVSRYGPQLQRLAFETRQFPTLGLHSLSSCTGLVQLELTHDEFPMGYTMTGEATILRIVSQLRGLQQLQLQTRNKHCYQELPDTSARSLAEYRQHATALQQLSALTALTHLQLQMVHHRREDTDWGARTQLQQRGPEVLRSLRTVWNVQQASLTAALRCMPQLQHLDCQDFHLPASEVSTLTALTHLGVAGLLGPTNSPAAAAAPLPAGSVTLPPQLQTLCLLRGAVRTLTAVRPCASLQAVAMTHDAEHHLSFNVWDVSTDGRRLLPAAVRAVRGAVQLLAREREREGSSEGSGAGPYGGQPLSVGTVGRVTMHLHPPAGQEGQADHAAWIRKLRPLNRHKVVLSGFALRPTDLLCIARTLDMIRVLDLRGCSFLLSALPALANLPHMRVLGFSAEACTGVTTEQLESALLLTAVAAGSLRKLVARDVPDRDMAATVRHRVEGGLAAHGVEGVLVLVRVPDGHSDFDGDDDDVEDDEEQEEEQQEEEEEGEEDEDEGGEETEED